MKYVCTVKAESAVDYIVEARNSAEAEALFDRWKKEHRRRVITDAHKKLKVADIRTQSATEVYGEATAALIPVEISPETDDGCWYVTKDSENGKRFSNAAGFESLADALNWLTRECGNDNEKILQIKSTIGPDVPDETIVTTSGAVYIIRNLYEEE